MHVQIEDLSPVEKKLAVEIPWEKVREKLDRAYRELGHQVKLNGFRPGKVPRSVLEARFGKAVQNEVAKELVQESFLATVSEHKIEPVAEPVVEEAVLKPGEAFRYSARIEIRAPIELKLWEGLAGVRRVVEVTEAEVDKAVEQKRLMHTEFRPITGRETTAASDVMIVAVKGKVGEHDVDKPEVSVDLSEPAHEPLPGLALALTGIRLDAKDLPLTLHMPADHEQKEIAGATAELKVTVKDVREKVIPDVDDEFAKDTGEADSLAELRGKLRERLEHAARERAQRDLREGLLKELVKHNPIPVAPALVERGIDSQLKRARMSFAMQGVDLDQTGIDMGGMRERLREGASEEVRGQLLLEALADAHQLEVSEADVDARVAELAQLGNKRPAKLKAEMEKEGSLESLRFRIRQEKALDLVASRATIEEVSASDAPATTPEAAPATETATEAPTETATEAATEAAPAPDTGPEENR
jgi:trigger factor